MPSKKEIKTEEIFIKNALITITWSDDRNNNWMEIETQRKRMLVGMQKLQTKKILDYFRYSE